MTYGSKKTSIVEEELQGSSKATRTLEVPTVAEVEAQMANLGMEQEQYTMWATDVEDRSSMSASSSTCPTERSCPTEEEKAEADSRSVHVGNVDYGVSEQILESFFRGCGLMKRVTIPRDRFNGGPKGFAYVEFEDGASIQAALMMTGTVLNGRPLKVSKKRTNRPGISTTDRPPRFPVGNVAVQYGFNGGVAPPPGFGFWTGPAVFPRI